jgi:hypothetical protein
MSDEFCKNCGYDIDECACCPECGEFDGCECDDPWFEYDDEEDEEC